MKTAAELAEQIARITGELADVNNKLAFAKANTTLSQAEIDPQWANRLTRSRSIKREQLKVLNADLVAIKARTAGENRRLHAEKNKIARKAAHAQLLAEQSALSARKQEEKQIRLAVDAVKAADLRQSFMKAAKKMLPESVYFDLLKEAKAICGVEWTEKEAA